MKSLERLKEEFFEENEIDNNAKPYIEKIFQNASESIKKLELEKKEEVGSKTEIFFAKTMNEATDTTIDAMKTQALSSVKRVLEVKSSIC